MSRNPLHGSDRGRAGGGGAGGSYQRRYVARQRQLGMTTTNLVLPEQARGVVTRLAAILRACHRSERLGGRVTTDAIAAVERLADRLEQAPGGTAGPVPAADTAVPETAARLGALVSRPWPEPDAEPDARLELAAEVMLDPRLVERVRRGTDEAGDLGARLLAAAGQAWADGGSLGPVEACRGLEAAERRRFGEALLRAGRSAAEVDALIERAEPPTPRQLAFAQRLADERAVRVPEQALSSRADLSLWLSEQTGERRR